MSAPEIWTAHSEPNLDYVRRMRMMGVHVPYSGFRVDRVNGGSLPDEMAVRRSLAVLPNDRGPVTEMSWFTARRPVARVRFGDGGPDLVMKWADQADLRSDNEFVMRGVLDGLSLPTLTRQAIPAIVAVDHDSGLVVSEAVAGAVTWSDVVAGGGAPRAEELVTLGAAVAGLHTVDVSAVRDGHPDRRARFPMSSMRRLTAEELAYGLGADFGDFVVVMQAVDEHLRELTDGWSHDCLVHFDLRDDNVLVGSPDEDTCLALVDWEMCGFGDPMYDLGVLVGQVLFHGLPRIYSIGSTQATRMVRMIVGGYDSVRRLTSVDRERMTRFAGVFLLMVALGRLEKVGGLGRIGHLSLMVGRRLIEETTRNAVVLSGSGGSA